MDEASHVSPAIQVIDGRALLVHHDLDPSQMQGLPDNPGPEETPVTTCKYSMFSTSQCPKALSWMASLALAAGQVEDAENWLVELIGAMLFRGPDVEVNNLDVRASRTGIERTS
jgi:hypothetical protein